MSARSVSFSLEEDYITRLNALVDEVGGGNRSRFLRLLIEQAEETLAAERRAARRREMEALHEEMCAERGGKVYTPEETLDLIAGIVAA